MTVVMKPTKRNNRYTSTFDRMFDEFFNTDVPMLANGNGMKNRPSVNVVESGDAFRIEVAAPGLEKGDFDVNVDKDVLTISTKKEQKREEGEKVRKLEFSYHEFKRSFRLPKTIDAEAIEATYDNGILNVTLPKREEAKEKPARKIEIA